jgi:UDP-N-acetylglucosamine 4,6-dehydratase/5-epimerase
MDGKKILVTGGTGSFGNAFISHVLANYNPERVVVYSRDEFKQYTMAERFAGHSNLRFFIGDVRDADRLSYAMRDIDMVFHAAAMKQVVAAEYNPFECIKTNIIGAENIISIAIKRNIPKVVAVSTDKAVKPINLYGASKACMEKLFVAANHLAGAGGPRFSCVRYGNVIGSRGSVIPVFMEQRKTGQITITDDRMTRFWLRIEDGVKFVDFCSQVMHGGEVFVKKVPSMKVTDLAKAIAPECSIKTIGIRPGEKLHECMVSEEESMMALEFPDYFVIEPQIKMWEPEGRTQWGGQTGVPVAQGFSYSSDNNTDWLGHEALHSLIDGTTVVSG